MWIEKEEPYADEDEHWHQLADRKNIAGNRRLPHAENIECCQGQHDGDNDQHTRHGCICRRPKKPEVADHQVAVRSESGQSRQPNEPTNFKCDHWPKGFSRVEVRPTCFIKAAADFRKAQNDQHHDQRAYDERDQAVRADQSVNLRRQTENARADDAIDRDRDQVPSADAADQAFA